MTPYKLIWAAKRENAKRENAKRENAKRENAKRDAAKREHTERIASGARANVFFLKKSLYYVYYGD
jgi:hypothetical protein